MPTPVASEPSIPCSAVCVDAQLQPGDLALSTVRIMIRYDKVSYSKQEGCKRQDCPNYGSWSMQSMHGAFGSPGFTTQSAAQTKTGAQAEAGEPHPGAASSNGGCWWLRSLSKSGEILELLQRSPKGPRFDTFDYTKVIQFINEHQFRINLLRARSLSITINLSPLR